MGRPAKTRRQDHPAINPHGIAEDDGRQPKAILASLEARGITFEIDGSSLRKVAGDLTTEDREDVRACKFELMTLLRLRKHGLEHKPQPWDGTEAIQYLQKSREAFKGLWDDLEAMPPNQAKQRAAFAILTDGLAMLAEGLRDHDLERVRDKCLYIELLCNRVRESYKEVESAAFNQRG